MGAQVMIKVTSIIGIAAAFVHTKNMVLFSSKFFRCILSSRENQAHNKLHWHCDLSTTQIRLLAPINVRKQTIECLNNYITLCISAWKYSLLHTYTEVYTKQLMNSFWLVAKIHFVNQNRNYIAFLKQSLAIDNRPFRPCSIIGCVISSSDVILLLTIHFFLANDLT